MKKIKVLNLYAGIGGNRKLWENVEVTAVEIDPNIAKIYSDFFPEDKVIVADAHQYLLEHYKEFDFIWSSPPCPSHSRVKFAVRNLYELQFPDFRLYQEIIFLQYNFKGKWCVENVISYYPPLIKPTQIGKHYYWSNFPLNDIAKLERKDRGMDKGETLTKHQKRLGINIKKYTNVDKRYVLRNCVEPNEALHIFNMAFKVVQKTL